MPNSLKSLLPCPFCGSENIDASGWSSKNASGPACDDCGAAAGSTHDSHDENITAWNTRAPIAEGGGELANTQWMLEAVKALNACGMGIHATALACLAEGIRTGRVVSESLSRQGGGYDRELIAKMLDELEPVVGLQHIRESVANQARLLRAAANRDAAGVHTGRAE